MEKARQMPVSGILLVVECKQLHDQISSSHLSLLESQATTKSACLLLIVVQSISHIGRMTVLAIDAMQNMLHILDHIL